VNGCVSGSCPVADYDVSGAEFRVILLDRLVEFSLVIRSV
jgi:hypothetical protein